MTADDLSAVAANSGHIDTAWLIIKTLRARPDTPVEVVTAINDVETEYFHTYDDLRKQVIATSTTGEYPVSGKEFFDRATTGPCWR